MIDDDLATRLNRLPRELDLAQSLDDIAQNGRREGYSFARTLGFRLRRQARRTLQQARGSE